MLTAVLAGVQCLSLPAAETGALDVTLTTCREERSGTASRITLRTRFVIDEAKVYYIEEVVGGDAGTRLPGREVLHDGELLYRSNAFGVTTVEDASSMERFASNLFLCRYADAAGLDLPNTRLEIGQPTVAFDRSFGQPGPYIEPHDDGTCTLVLRRNDGRTRTWRYELRGGVVAVLEGEVWVGGALSRRFVSRDHFPVGRRLLPAAVRYEEFDASGDAGAPVAVEELHVVEALPSAAGFPERPSFLRPGTMVRDARYGNLPMARDGYLSYVLPASLATLEAEWSRLDLPVARRPLLSLPGVLAGLLLSLVVVSARRRIACKRQRS